VPRGAGTVKSCGRACSVLGRSFVPKRGHLPWGICWCQNRGRARSTALGRSLGSTPRFVGKVNCPGVLVRADAWAGELGQWPWDAILGTLGLRAGPTAAGRSLGSKPWRAGKANCLGRSLGQELWSGGFMMPGAIVCVEALAGRRGQLPWGACWYQNHCRVGSAALGRSLWPKPDASRAGRAGGVDCGGARWG